MAAERGRAFLLKVGDGQISETFTSVGGQRVTSFKINGEYVDVSDKNSEWREGLTGAHVKSISMGCSGVFKNTASEALLQEYALGQLINNFQVVFQDGDTWEGGFLVTSLEYTGEYNGAREYSMSLESSGEITFDQTT